MKKTIFILLLIFTISISYSQEKVENYYPISTDIKEAGALDKDGFPIGIWKYHLKSGAIDYTINWNSNYIKKYFASGTIKEEGTFLPDTGTHIGTWITYNKDGSVQKKEHFDKKGLKILK